MPQAVWTGQLSFGLVNIPVKLYSATAPKQVRFHQYDAESGGRIRYRRVAAARGSQELREPPDDAPMIEDAPAADEDASSAKPAGDPVAPAQRGGAAEPSRTEAEVPWEKIVKGYEIEPGRVVTVTPEELSALAPERSRVLEVEQFVALRDIDPVHFDKSYYVAPQPGVGAERPYWLLHRAMEAAAEVAVGRFVMRTKEYLAAVRPGAQVLMLETLFYADEVRDPKHLWVPPAEDPPERELRVARELIEALVGEWNPDRHRDEYRERVLDLLRSKSGEARVVQEPEEELPSPAIDLMEALKASVEAARAARGGQRQAG
ncbi:MAG TPA: Ku protein [Actinomycetota bacterium]|nr:Ku protein [Actinomycetota bacterium]